FTCKSVSRVHIFLIELLGVLGFGIAIAPRGFIDNIKQVSEVAFQGETGFLFYVYILLLVSLFVLMIKYLFGAYRYSRGIKRMQIRYVLIGIFSYWIIAVPVGVIAPALGITDYAFLDTTGSLLWITLTTYAIFKHHLFNIKVIAVELLSMIVSIIIFVKFVLSKSTEERIISGILLVSAVTFSVIFVRSIIKDIKTRKHIEQLSKDLVVANDQLRRMDKQKSDFVSIASHQLRTPLTAIKGYSSLLLEGSFGDIADKPRKAILKIFEASQRMVMTVENFLTVSRIERGRMFYKFEVFDLQKVAKKMVEEMNVVAIEHSLDLRFREDVNRKFPIRADLIKTKQVIHNLLDESIRHTSDGFIDASLSYSQHGDYITLAISDTGEGATKNRLKHLFDKYESDVQSNEIRKETGVELFIVKEIVKAHRGKIWAESEGVGMGLTFFIELPQVKEKVLT
ncbi:MAG: hypothetical protein KAJ10_16015, partial [Thermodesulfovibrionia bacterium]|nr:hypothetical protein [Thermodesulfovibrionia bacterium]